MTDWLKSMQQSYEYYKVNPTTWMDEELLDKIVSSDLSRDLEADTLGSASYEFDSITDDFEECYVRTYLITIQNGIKDKVPLGTYLVQAPSTVFDGKVKTMTADGYTPLIELKEGMPPIGYSVLKQITPQIIPVARDICLEHMRAPVIAPDNGALLYNDFVANTDDTWFSFVNDLVSNAKFSLSLDEYGRVLFEPNKNFSGMAPVWEYNDDNSSILMPDISEDKDIYGIPNVVEVIYSSGRSYYRSVVKNEEPNSPTSTVSRGREIVYRETEPSISGTPNQAYIDAYAESLLESLSRLEHRITYSHGYCPVRIGDCVMLNYEKAGITNVKAMVTSQNIKCETGCIVDETAVYVTNLWR